MKKFTYTLLSFLIGIATFAASEADNEKKTPNQSEASKKPSEKASFLKEHGKKVAGGSVVVVGGIVAFVVYQFAGGKQLFAKKEKTICAIMPAGFAKKEEIKKAITDKGYTILKAVSPPRNSKKLTDKEAELFCGLLAARSSEPKEYSMSGEVEILLLEKKGDAILDFSILVGVPGELASSEANKGTLTAQFGSGEWYNSQTKQIFKFPVCAAITTQSRDALKEIFFKDTK